MNPPLLTQSERHYLYNLIKPFAEYVLFVTKNERATTSKLIQQQLCIHLKNTTIELPWFEEGRYYLPLEVDEPYSLLELGITEIH